jgi:formate hydrogenlyase subunit 3/multisubunit Na+/H+ antiporter MnhD subunit
MPVSHLALSTLHFTPLIAAFALLSLATFFALLSKRNAKHAVFSSFLFLAGLLMVVGVVNVWPRDEMWTCPPPIYLGLAPLSLRIDPLASLFIGLLGVICIAVSVFSPGYMLHLKDRVHSGFYWSCLYLFVLSMALVMLSANAITFLVFWEVMALCTVALVAADPIRHRSQQAALIYLGATRVSTALIAAGFIWFHFLTNSWTFADWKVEALPVMPAFVLFFGLCIKAGIWPFHIWLPYAHPEAPAPVSALMSGVMVKVAIYAILRLFVVTGEHAVTLAYCGLFLGIISAVWGVLFALMQQDLKRLLAYSTVENVGLLLTGISVTILARSSGYNFVAELALGATLLHVINHGLFKSLLFLSAGAINSSTHSRDLGVLGGLAKNMPWTMICFFIGSIAICAMPPLNGFASKWLLYQSLFQLSFQADQTVERGIALAFVGALSSVGALSLACFTKALGISFLGRPRSDAVARATECSEGMIAGQAILAGLCVVLGISIQPAMHYLEPITRAANVATVPAMNLFTIPQTTLCLIGLSSVAVVYALAFSGPVRKYITWDCGYGDLSARAEETGSSFSQPIGRIFSSFLRYRMFTEIKGRDRRHFPEAIKVETSMLFFLESYIYRPTIVGLQTLSTWLVKLQTASIHIHLLYVFLALLLLIYVGASI